MWGRGYHRKLWNQKEPGIEGISVAAQSAWKQLNELRPSLREITPNSGLKADCFRK